MVALPATGLQEQGTPIHRSPTNENAQFATSDGEDGADATAVALIARLSNRGHPSQRALHRGITKRQRPKS